MHMDIAQNHFYANIYSKDATPRRVCPDLAPAPALLLAVRTLTYPMMSPTSATSEVDFNARTDVVDVVAAPMQQARQKNVSRDNNWWFFIGPRDFTKRNGTFIWVYGDLCGFHQESGLFRRIVGNSKPFFLFRCTF